MNNKSIRLVVSISLNLILLIAGVFIISIAGSKAYTFGHSIFDEQSVNTSADAREVEVTISDGVSAKQLSKILFDKGLVEDKTIFYFQVTLSDYKGKFIGGTYTLRTDMKPTDMMKVLTKTDTEEDSTGR
jgi:UPF0755 protein